MTATPAEIQVRLSDALAGDPSLAEGLIARFSETLASRFGITGVGSLGREANGYRLVVGNETFHIPARGEEYVMDEADLDSVSGGYYPTRSFKSPFNPD